VTFNKEWILCEINQLDPSTNLFAILHKNRHTHTLEHFKGSRDTDYVPETYSNVNLPLIIRNLGWLPNCAC